MSIINDKIKELRNMARDRKGVLFLVYRGENKKSGSHLVLLGDKLDIQNLIKEAEKKSFNLKDILEGV